jgi:hypothetical protein
MAVGRKSLLHFAALPPSMAVGRKNRRSLFRGGARELRDDVEVKVHETVQLGL